MPTSLVTGGAGFLGSHLCEALLAKGHRVICLDNLETGSLANVAHLRDDAFSFLHHDVSEPIAVDEPLDFVYHLAALASPIDGRSAGERNRTSKGRSPPGPKPGASASSATPARPEA